MRLDTLLLCSNDIAISMMDENLSSTDLVRLCLCCKDLHALVLTTPGLFYLPMLKTLPYTTGLSIGRDSAYYLSILKLYFQPHLPDIANTTARVRYVLGRHFPFLDMSADATVKEIIRLCRTICFSAAGRNLLLECVGDCRRVYGCMMDSEALAALNRFVFIVDHAFCVQRRRLQPGRVWRRRARGSGERVVVPEYECESDYLGQGGC
jgi:hypothetical protein